MSHTLREASPFAVCRQLPQIQPYSLAGVVIISVLFLILIGWSRLGLAETHSAAESQQFPGARQQLTALKKFDSRSYTALNTAILPRVELSLNSSGEVFLEELPRWDALSPQSRYSAISSAGDLVTFTIDPQLQREVEQIVKKSRGSHIAVAVIEPQSGKVLALTGRSGKLKSPELHSRYPAASIFKIITSAGALETGRIQPDSPIRFRGGMYTLNSYNYLPSRVGDRQILSFAEALGKSCNPAFARVAYNNLTPTVLAKYGKRFGFNQELGFEGPLRESSMFIPTNTYEFTRTAAGFGKVTLSPLHGASIIGGLATGGEMKTPVLVESIRSRDGEIRYLGNQHRLSKMVEVGTARELVQMLETTTKTGTGRNAFANLSRSPLRGMPIASKTGTLLGEDPKGLNNWFIAAAPSRQPKVAIAVIVNGERWRTTKATQIGREVLEAFFKLHS